MGRFVNKPRRNRNEGWLTFDDGRKVPVYTMEHAVMREGRLAFPKWTDQQLAELEEKVGASPQRKARWRKENELTQRLLRENNGVIRVFVTKADNDQSDVAMMELIEEGDYLLLKSLGNRRDKGNCLWLLELQSSS